LIEKKIESGIVDCVVSCLKDSKIKSIMQLKWQWMVVPLD